MIVKLTARLTYFLMEASWAWSCASCTAFSPSRCSSAPRNTLNSTSCGGDDDVVMMVSRETSQTGAKKGDQLLVELYIIGREKDEKGMRCRPVALKVLIDPRAALVILPTVVALC